MEVYDHQNKRQGGRTGQFAAGLVVGIFTTLLVVCVAYLGFQIQQTVENARQESQQVNAGGAGQDGSLSETVADKIDRLVYMIENYYYKDDVTREDLEEGIYQGLMEAVGDPYTNYFTADDFETFMEQATGAYYGIGAYVAQDVERNYPKINSPIPGSPAEEVGMRPDDIIYEVDGVSTYGMDLDKVVSLIKGEEGTTVNITLYRKGEYLDVEVQRRQVEIPTVEQKMLGDGMAYIRIIEFDDVTPGQFRTALDASRGSGMKGLVLDLRGNPGGSVNAVVDIARMLLPKGLVVYTEDKYGKREEYTCDGSNEFELPLVVLVVFFSKTYIFSVLLCIFYSVLSLTAESSFGALPKFLCWLMPIPLTNLWCAGDMVRHGVKGSLGELQYLIPSTMQTVLILSAMTVLSILLIDRLYKKRGGN